MTPTIPRTETVPNANANPIKTTNPRSIFFFFDFLFGSLLADEDGDRGEVDWGLVTVMFELESGI